MKLYGPNTYIAFVFFLHREIMSPLKVFGLSHFKYYGDNLCQNHKVQGIGDTILMVI
jgi:hypothetical protein